MSIWDEENLPYLLFLFDNLEVKNFEELSSIIFLLNYYNLLENGTRFFSYRFVKNSNFIKAIQLEDNIEEIILSKLVAYKKKGFFSTTELGKQLLYKFKRDFIEFNRLLQKILVLDYNKEVSDFVLVQRANEKQEIKI